MTQWPELPYQEWRETLQTLHRWMQVVGKIKIAKMPWTNHSWNSAFAVTPRGLGTGVIYHGSRAFSLDFDFVDQVLQLSFSDRPSVRIDLIQESVASFHHRCFATLVENDLQFSIHERPNELADRIPLCDDETHHTYQPDAANRFWRALLEADRILKLFRSRFVGKASPVHFFWGSFDLSVSRFSGRRAPEHPGGFPNLPDRVTREAYSHEVSSAGFWPGNDQVPFPAFYSYAYPVPVGFDQSSVSPREAYFHLKLREFLLPYDEVRKSRYPDAMVLDFFQSTYVAAANLGGWDRESLERSPYLDALQAEPPTRELFHGFRTPSQGPASQSLH